MDKVSIIIPCFNSGFLLERAINSAKSQSYKNVEIIVVNDGSTDKFTLNYLKKLNDIKVIHQINKGLPSARNKGISNANGKYILFLDSDDWIAKNTIKLMLKVIKNSKCGFVFSNIILEGEKFGLYKKKFNFFEQLFINHLPYLILIKKNTLIQVGCYDEKMKFGYEDWELNIRLVKNNYFPKKIEEPVFHYRVSNSGMLKSISKKYHSQIFRYIKNKHSDLYRFKSLIQIYNIWKKEKMNYHPYLYFLLGFFQFIFPASINNKINVFLYEIKLILKK